MQHPALSLLAGTIALCLAETTSAQTVPLTPSITWDAASLTLVQPHGNYARLVRLPDTRLVCAYEVGPRVFLGRSTDNGKTWSAPIPVAAWPDGALSNPDLLALRDGTLLCFYNQRPRNDRRPPGAPPRPYGIALSRSTDGGTTWDASATLFQAGTDPGTGCWEPAAVEVPAGAMTGEIQLFFANEQPYPRTTEQEISLLRSADGGRSWTGPQPAIFRARSRDGMPSPLVLRDHLGVAVAVEDPGLSGTFKPSIAFSDLATDWRGGPVPGNSPRRWGALASPLPPAVYAGAPCLRQLPAGETVLSFQQGDNPNDLRSTRMAVCLGDAHARNFGPPGYPFPVTPGHGQVWNSLFVKDAQTITAVTSAFLNGVGGIWTIDGHIVHPDNGPPGNSPAPLPR